MNDRKLTAILISPRDNVATVTKDTLPGETVTYLRNGKTETIVSAGVPKYHKIALCEISKGADIYKYGEIMKVYVITDLPDEDIELAGMIPVKTPAEAWERIKSDKPGLKDVMVLPCGALTCPTVEC